MKAPYAIPGTATSNGDVSTPNNGNTQRPSTKGPGKRGRKPTPATGHHSSDAEVNEGLGPVVDDKKAAGRRGKAGQGAGFGHGDSGPTNNRVASKGGRPNAQVKAVVPTRALPTRPGRNVHPAGQPKTRRSKEQIEADREAGAKALEEKIFEVQMAKKHLAQLNLMEEHEEDDLPVLHPQRLSTAIHKRRHIDIETDSDNECFDLREVDDGSNTDDSSSESDKASKTKTKASVQCHVQIGSPFVTHAANSLGVKNASKVLPVKNS